MPRVYVASLGHAILDPKHDRVKSQERSNTTHEQSCHRLNVFDPRKQGKQMHYRMVLAQFRRIGFASTQFRSL